MGVEAQQTPVIEFQPTGVTQSSLGIWCDLGKPCPFLGLSFLIYQRRMG